MKIQGKTLVICQHDFDHIMYYNIDCNSDSRPSEVFKEGLKAELFMNGLEDKEFDEIKLVFD